MIDSIQFKIASPSMSEDFIRWLSNQSLIPFSCISSIYYPCWRGDYTTARSWENPDIDSLNKYIDLLRKTINAGIQPEVLFQGIEVVRSDVLKRYLDLGVRKFTITNDRTADKLKEMDPSVFISASIVKALSPTEIKMGNYGMYDEICLHFYYNINLSEIEQLPTKYDYSICGNSGCLPYCTQCVNHWISDEMYECYYKQDKNHRKYDIGFNYAEYQKYFANTIKRVKILDRLSSVKEMQEALTLFCNDTFIRDRSYFDRGTTFPNIKNKFLVNR